MTNFDPKKLGEEADELIRNQSQKPEDSDTPDPETLELVDDAVADPEVAIAQADSTSATDQGTPPEEIQDDDAVVDTNLALADMQKQLDTAEQRWKVLQGMLTKKDEELGAMRDLLAGMSQPAQEVPAASQEPAKSLVTKADIEEYGQEYVDFITRVSLSAVQGQLGSSTELNALASRITLLEGSVQGVEQASANTAQSVFFSELTKISPEWRVLNNDASFLQWLDKVDPFTGETRASLLSLAVSNSDSARAATFFNAYQSETAPAPAAPQEPADTAPAPTGKDKLVAPGKTKAVAPVPNEKRNWTRAEIAKLYDDKMSGKITGKEFDRLERDIFAAQTDGLGRIEHAA
ncbi:MAG: hypothetical protein BMS9Abin11_1760 [Gammaproteobacteria bacterium]|nr:MAG: hypothetical protein BMS9Abin11_1760 [Gammaproteobacteria bacterium]